MLKILILKPYIRIAVGTVWTTLMYFIKMPNRLLTLKKYPCGINSIAGVPSSAGEYCRGVLEFFPYTRSFLLFLFLFFGLEDPDSIQGLFPSHIIYCSFIIIAYLIRYTNLNAILLSMSHKSLLNLIDKLKINLQCFYPRHD